MHFILLIVITLALGGYATYRVQSAYAKYSRIPSRRGITGAEAAAMVLRSAGITDVQVVPIRGHLNDHFHPLEKKIALSESNYHGTSLAALGVAAHEAGHAIQQKVGYAPLALRSALIPITTFSSKALPFIILAAFFGIFGPGASHTVVLLVVAAYLILTLFQLVTLPVEFDASRRAKRKLEELGVIDRQEMVGVSETLSAAAFTYVAAFITSLLTMLYWLMVLRR